MSMVGRSDVVEHAEEPWFEEARIVDQEWMELLVMTPKGEKVYYRVPRRTLFRDIDRPGSP